MSATIRTYVVVGVRASDALTVAERQKVEKKFDPDTGAPVKKVTTEYVPTLLGQERPGLEPGPENWIYPTELLGGLQVFSTGGHDRNVGFRRQPVNPYAGDYDEYVLGVPLHEGKDYKTAIYECDDKAVAEASARVADILRAKGVTNLVPKLFVVAYVSY